MAGTRQGTTLTEVARAAEVSLATASRAFKDPERLAADTRARVLAAGAELGYLSAGPRVLTYAVVVPDAANPVFASQIAVLQDRGWVGGHRMLLFNTAENLAREADVLRSLDNDVDGVILVSPRLAGPDIQSCLRSTPVVVINAAVDFCPSVLLDTDTGIRQAFEHLVALGHRHVAYAPGPRLAWANQRRQQLVEIVAAAWDVQLTVVGNQAASVEGGLAAAASLVASGATAVLAYNDLVAIGVRAGARDLGRECPRDLSIIGIDDLNIAAISEPALTSIRVEFAAACARAFHLLTELVAGRNLEPNAEHHDSQLIVRRSTAHAAHPPPRSRSAKS